MALDPRTPVLVGAAAVTQHVDDPGAEASEPLDLMEQAVRAARREDAGSKVLLEQADSIWAPRGFWAYSDPGRILAERFGAASARSRSSAEIGILQTSVLGRAARAIAAGDADRDRSSAARPTIARRGSSAPAPKCR